MPIESFVTTFFADWLNWTFFWWRTLFALSQNATACDNKLQIAVRNDMRLFLRFTKYYSSTTLYYTVLLQYYSVLQSTTPVLLCTTQYYSSTTLYYTVLLQYYSVLQSTTPVLLCTTKYYSVLQTHQILRLPRKITVQNLKEICWKRMKRHFQCAADPTMIRPWSEHDPTMKPSVRNPPRNRGSFSRPPRAFCIEKYNISRSGYHSKFYRILRLPRKVTLELHQILRLPQKMNLMIDPWHKWNVIYNAQSNMRHCPNSPNTAPATKNESHDWSLTQMKRYLQCAEQHASLSKLTKYCACHEKWISWLILDTNETLFTMRGATCVIVQTHQILRLPRKMNLMIDPWHKWNVIYNARSNMRHSPNSPNTAPATKNDRPKSQRNLLKTDETSFPMRGRSDHDPSMIRPWSEHDPSMIRPWNRQSATRLATEVTFHAHHEHSVLKNTTFRAPAIIPNFTEYCACHEKWHLHFTKYCACHEKWHLHFTKYCACHEKWISWLILDTNETLFTMRGATCVIVQTHQILRLPRKMTVQNLKEICWKRMKRHFQCAADPTMIRPWSEHDPSMIRAWSDHETVSPWDSDMSYLVIIAYLDNIA